MILSNLVDRHISDMFYPFVLSLHDADIHSILPSEGHFPSLSFGLPSGHFSGGHLPSLPLTEPPGQFSIGHFPFSSFGFPSGLFSSSGFASTPCVWVKYLVDL